MEASFGDIPVSIIYVLAGIIGLAFGSFANVLIYRLPREESLIRPPSRCPTCQRRIRPWENIPVLSWILLGGRCPGCRERISIQYLLVELAGGFFCILSVRIYGFNYAGIAYWLLFLALLSLVIIDLKHWLLPFAFTIPMTAIGLLGAVFFSDLKSLYGNLLPFRTLADSLLGIGIGLLLFLAMLVGGKLLFKREAMGGGDVAFGAMAGAFLGWKLTILLVFAASLIGTLFFLLLLALRKNPEDRLVPFGPFLAAGMILCLFWGDTILRWYIGLLRT